MMEMMHVVLDMFALFAHKACLRTGDMVKSSLG